MRHWLGLTRENRKEEARKGENDIYIERERFSLFSFSFSPFVEAGARTGWEAGLNGGMFGVRKS
jgi:hypothetical protein